MPESEKYGIRSQIARASVSIAANIAEGTGRGTAKDYRRFLRLAYASAWKSNLMGSSPQRMNWSIQGGIGDC
jgi:four helix bundle protein